MISILSSLLLAGTVVLGGTLEAVRIALAAKASDWDAGWDYKGMSQFGRSVSDIDMLLIALGKCRYAPAVEEIVRKANALTADDAYSHFRAIAQAAEGCGTTEAARQDLAKALHRLLSLPGVGGHMREKPESVPGFADAAADRERTLVLRELVLARALYAVGDCESLGSRTLRAYTRDYRKAYAHHARLVLDRSRVVVGDVARPTDWFWRLKRGSVAVGKTIFAIV